MEDMTPDELAQLLAEAEAHAASEAPVSKTLTQLLQEGHPHKGGLAQLAAAEQDGTLFGFKPRPSSDAPSTLPTGDPAAPSTATRPSFAVPGTLSYPLSERKPKI